MPNGAYRLKLKWTKRALQQLKAAQDYIARDNPAAACDVAERIAQATRLLLTQPQMGRGKGEKDAGMGCEANTLPVGLHC